MLPFPFENFGISNQYLSAAARAAVTNIATQGIGIVTGLQQKFNWRSVAAASVSTVVGEAARSALNETDLGGLFGTGKGLDIARASLTGISAGLTSAALRGGRVSIQQIATDAFGNALGNSVVDLLNGSSVQEIKTFEQDRAERTSALYLTDRSSGASDNTAAAQIDSFYSDIVGGTESTDTDGRRYPSNYRFIEGGPAAAGAARDRLKVSFGGDGKDTEIENIAARLQAKDSDSYNKNQQSRASYIANENAQTDILNRNSVIREYISNINENITAPVIGTLEQIVLNPEESFNYALEGVTGLGKGLINVVPETATSVYKGYRFLGAAAGEAIGVLSPGALGRTINELENTTGRVLDYSNYSQQIGGFTGEVVAPVFASRAASLAASAYRTYAAEVGQYGGFGQFPISGGASAGVDFRAIGFNGVNRLTVENVGRLEGISNPLPNDGYFSRVMPAKYAEVFARGEGTLGGGSEVFIGAAEDLSAVATRTQVQQRLSLFNNFEGTAPNISGDAIVRFKLSDLTGLATPVEATGALRGFGFIQGGRTGGAVREFIIKNGTAQDIGAHSISIIKSGK